MLPMLWIRQACLWCPRISATPDSCAGTVRPTSGSSEPGSGVFVWSWSYSCQGLSRSLTRHVSAMKTLSPDDIECLLGVRACKEHPLDILGYGDTSEGARRFRTEHPDVLPQLEAYVRSVLRAEGIFPKGTNPEDAGYRTFIVADGGSFRVSSMEELGFSRYARMLSSPM